jgi:hypothetical protein
MLRILPHPRSRRRQIADVGKCLLVKVILVDLIGIEPMTLPCHTDKNVKTGNRPNRRTLTPNSWAVSWVVAGQLTCIFSEQETGQPLGKR